MDPWDYRLKESIDYSKERGVKLTFEEADLGDVHPNTVKFIMKEKSKGIETTVTGSSIGGGNIVIFEVRWYKV